MLEKKVEQKLFKDMENYHHIFWSGVVASVVESLYKNADEFVSAYGNNSKKVINKIVGKMKIVPIDVKEMLMDMYGRLVPSGDDGGGGPRKVTA